MLMKAKQIMRDVWEAGYPDNIGFEEMAYKKLIRKVIGVNLK